MCDCTHKAEAKFCANVPMKSTNACVLGDHSAV